MRLIDADKLTQGLYAIRDRETGTPRMMANWFLSMIDDTPTVQPQGIDKDKLIEEIRKLREYEHEVFNSRGYYDEITCISKDNVIKIINQQPTSDGWIPVSEGLPKPYEEVIFCNNIISCYGSIDSDGVWWASDVIPFKQFMKAYNVKAWQPLPPAYKESE